MPTLREALDTYLKIDSGAHSPAASCAMAGRMHATTIIVIPNTFIKFVKRFMVSPSG